MFGIESGSEVNRIADGGVGMQNAGLASGIAKEMGKIATLGLAPAVFGPLMNISGSILASWWHNRPPRETLEEDGIEPTTEPALSN